MKENSRERLTEAGALGAISAAFIAAGIWMAHTSPIAGWMAGTVPLILGGGFLIVMLMCFFRA